MDKGLIYKITCTTTGKCYIGKTIRPLAERMSHHFNGYDSCVKLNNAIKEYGKNSFIVEVIANNIPYNELDALERFYITQYDSVNNGYNVKYGNRGHKGRPFHTLTEELQYNIIALYNAGYNTNDIADELKVCRTSVYNTLKKHNIKCVNRKPTFNKKSKIDFETFKELKLKGWKTKELAKFFNVAKSSIKRYYNRHKDIIFPRVSDTLTSKVEGENVL